MYYNIYIKFKYKFCTLGYVLHETYIIMKVLVENNIVLLPEAENFRDQLYGKKIPRNKIFNHMRIQRAPIFIGFAWRQEQSSTCIIAI